MLKIAAKRKIDAFELWSWRRVLKVTWLNRRTNASILQEINPSCSLEAIATKLKLSYFGHIMSRSSLMEKAIMLGIVEGKINQTKMEGGTERHLPKTDDWHRRIHK